MTKKRKQPAPYTVDEAIEVCRSYSPMGWHGEDDELEIIMTPVNPRCLKGAAKILANEVLCLRRREVCRD